MNTALIPDKVRELLALQRHEEAFRLSKTFAEYVRESWKIIEPGTVYMSNWHIDCVSEYLEAVKAGEIQDLLINMPPRMMKSILVSIDFPTWWWTSDPFERFMFTSFGDSLVKDHSLKRRLIIESEWYQQRWGSLSLMPEERKVILASDQNEKKEFKNTHEGVMAAAPIGGQFTGKGGNVLIIDDPQDPEKADSDVERLQAIQFYEGTLMTRLNNKQTGRKIGVMQRLHERDWSGHELAKKGSWVHLCLPAIAEEKTFVFMPRSKKSITREKNSVLWPERDSAEVLRKLKLGMTAQRFAGQYQQAPAPSAGNMLLRTWWQYYGLNTALPKFDMIVDSWDMTFKKQSNAEAKTKKEPDYCVGGKWGIKGANFYLLKMSRERMSFSEARESVKAMALSEPQANAVWVEESANGPAVIDSLHEYISGMTGINANKDKVERAAAASPALKAGNCFLPHPSICDPILLENVTTLIEECAVFPFGMHDDTVDHWSQMVNEYIKTRGGWLAWVEKRDEEEKEKSKSQQKKAGAVVHDEEKVAAPTGSFTFADIMK